MLHRFPCGDERPITYASRSLNSSEKNYNQIEKEGLAIIFGVTKYHLYLFGRKFTLRTDHKPLLKIFAPDSATPILAAAHLHSCSLLLSSYQNDIEFKPSAEVPSSDALSRLPLTTKFHSQKEKSLTLFIAINREKIDKFRWLGILNNLIKALDHIHWWHFTQQRSFVVIKKHDQ